MTTYREDIKGIDIPDMSTAAVECELVPDIQDLLRFINGRRRSKRVGLKNNSVNGIIAEDTIVDYLARRPHIGSGDLKEVLKSPLAFYFSQRCEEKKLSKSFELGSFVHKAFLEPEMFDRLIVEPEAKMNELKGVNHLIDFWTAKLSSSRPDAGIIFSGAAMHVKQMELDIEGISGKKEYLAYLKQHSGMISVPENIKSAIEQIKAQYKMYGGGIIPQILKNAKKECSFYGTDPDTGLPVKVRPDAFNTEENIGVNAIISFKTTSAETLDKFISDTAKYKYEVSEGMYQDVVSNVTGRNFSVTIMIMLQTVPPYSPAVFWWTPEDIFYGKEKYRSALRQIKDCYDKKVFPGFDVFAGSGCRGILEMKQPEWAHKMNMPVETEL